jgi:hypothetical protein
MPAGDELLVAELDRIGEALLLPRRASPVEAPIVLTGAYVDFIRAWGYACIGAIDRARAVASEARTALAPALEDRVHRFLVAAFEVAVASAIEDPSVAMVWPTELVEQLHALVRIERSKVERLRDASRILVWQRPEPRPVVRAAGDSEQLVDELRNLEPDLEYFDRLAQLPESAQTELLERAVPLLEVLPSPRHEACARAFAIVERLRWRDGFAIAGPLLIASHLAEQPIETLDSVLERVVRGLRRYELLEELRRVIDMVDAAVKPHITPRSKPTAREAAAARAGLVVEVVRQLLDGKRPAACEALAAELKKTKVPVEVRLATTRMLADAYALGRRDEALEFLDRARRNLRDVTDSLGTNTHFCLAVLHYVDSLVYGVARCSYTRW